MHRLQFLDFILSESILTEGTTKIFFIVAVSFCIFTNQAGVIQLFSVFASILWWRCILLLLLLVLLFEFPTSHSYVYLSSIHSPRWKIWSLLLSSFNCDIHCMAEFWDFKNICIGISWNINNKYLVCKYIYSLSM